MWTLPRLFSAAAFFGSVARIMSKYLTASARSPTLDRIIPICRCASISAGVFSIASRYGLVFVRELILSTDMKTPGDFFSISAAVGVGALCVELGKVAGLKVLHELWTSCMTSPLSFHL